MAERPMNADMQWEPDSDIHIKGYEWQEISSILQFFQSAMVAFNAIVARNIGMGTIKVRYLYEDDGTEVPEEEILRRQNARLKVYEENLKRHTATPKDGN